MKNIFSKITFDTASKRFYDDNGRLVVEDSLITKAEVSKYFGSEIKGYEQIGLDPAVQYNVLRPIDELEKALPAFETLPLLKKHVMDFAQDPQKEERVGAIGKAHIKNNAVYAPLSVWDAEAIKDIETEEKRELSVGYVCDYVREQGEYNGVPYELVMRNIKPNHVALCEVARVKGAKVSDEDNFQESKHPRDDDGKFKRSGEGQSKANSQKPKQEQKQSKATTQEMPRTPEEIKTYIKKKEQEFSAKANIRLKNEKPVAEVKGDEFEGASIDEKRDNAEEYFYDNFSGKKFKSEDWGKEIKILGAGKTISQSAYEDKINSIKHLPEIIKNSKYIMSDVDVKGNKNVKEWHYLASKIKIKKDKETSDKIVKFSVREDNMGNVYYNHIIEETEGLGGPSNKLGVVPSVTDSLTQQNEKVNDIINKNGSRTESAINSKAAASASKDSVPNKAKKVNSKVADSKGDIKMSFWNSKAKGDGCMKKKLNLLKAFGVFDEDPQKLKETEDIVSDFEAKLITKDEGNEKLKSILVAELGQEKAEAILAALNAEDAPVNDEPAPVQKKDEEEKIDVEKIKSEAKDEAKKEFLEIQKAKDVTEAFIGKVAVQDSATAYYQMGCKALGVSVQGLSDAEVKATFFGASAVAAKKVEKTSIAMDSAAVQKSSKDIDDIFDRTPKKSY